MAEEEERPPELEELARKLGINLDDLVSVKATTPEAMFGDLMKLLQREVSKVRFHAHYSKNLNENEQISVSFEAGDLEAVRDILKRVLKVLGNLNEVTPPQSS